MWSTDEKEYIVIVRAQQTKVKDIPPRHPSKRLYLRPQRPSKVPNAQRHHHQHGLPELPPDQGAHRNVESFSGRRYCIGRTREQVHRLRQREERSLLYETH